MKNKTLSVDPIKGAQEYQITVVIPSLGGRQIKTTVDALNSGEIVPKEIIIAIPKSAGSKVEDFFPHCKNVTILRTDIKGQVAQRAKGFLTVRNPLILQLDDDIILKADTLKKLAEMLVLLGPGNVIGPAFKNSTTEEPLSRFSVGIKGFAANMYFSCFYGLPWGKARMGALTQIGSTGSVDPRCFPDDLYSTQWLPGGCVLSYKRDLILYDFYPLPGKAFNEDGLHSYLRTKKGLRHFLLTSTIALVDPADQSITWRSFYNEARAQFAVSRQMGGGRVRTVTFVLAEAVRRYFK